MRSKVFYLLLVTSITLVVPTTKAPLIVTPLYNVALVPLTLCGALTSTSRVPAPNISIELVAPAADMLMENLMGCAAFAATFEPPL